MQNVYLTSSPYKEFYKGELILIPFVFSVHGLSPFLLFDCFCECPVPFVLFQNQFGNGMRNAAVRTILDKPSV